MRLFKQFQIDIGFDPDAVEYHAHIYSLGDNKVRVFKGTKMATITKEVSKSIRKKEIFNRKFPLEREQSRIILASNPVPQLIVPTGTNGR